MIVGGTPAPKREIVDIIMQTIPTDTIRGTLKIQAETDLHRRLDDFPKHQLVEVVQSTAEGRTALEEAKARYPLTTKPTLYLVSVSQWPNREALFSNSEDLAHLGFDGRVWFGNDRLVRSVYMITPLREYQNPLRFLEIPLVYEKKIEYIVSDPESEDYGEPDQIYSLEKALIWYSHQYNHALLLCGDFSAVKPILDYGGTKLGIRWQLPFMSEEMLQRLAEGATPRSASFSRLDNIFEDVFDAQTMTIFDQALGDSRSYQRLMNDESRQQTSGFYSNHPDLVFGGLGISRQYGRIWTPTKLRKDSLLALSMSLIQKTETELVRESDINLDGFIGYYRNVPVKIKKKKIVSSQRAVFEKLIKAIIIARRSGNLESDLSPDFIHDLICQRENLDLVIGLEANCGNCGSYLYRCKECQSPFQPTITDDQQVVFRCEKHPEQSIEDNQTLNCDCGGDLEATFSIDIRIFPGVELIKSLHGFLSALENQQYDGSFLIQGGILRLVPRKRIAINQYLLSDFKYWRVRAHFHQRNPADTEKEKYRQALNRIREKCSQNNWHPTKTMCNACMKDKISQKKILSGSKSSNICFPRIFGYVIDDEFDGIHHGHEIADIKYSDEFYETDTQLEIGIHLKSRVTPRKRGLGRSVDSVKELYMQYCYSVFLSARDRADLNVIGISIPNVINSEVIENFQYLSNQLGYPLIILAENEWINILDAAIEKAEVGG
ncbi:MAG: hypothetical protein L6461_19245 [Anaerolineae bacterium]|nr:hypothetical protein [Anaerolineae bacterium]